MMDKDKIDKKDHILDVAEKVFSELGYDGASTRMISGEAGVNMAMLNYYFGSKEGLYLAIFERKISAFRTLLQNIGNDDSISAWDKMERCIDNYVERIIANNCFQKLINRELTLNKRTELTDKMANILMTNVHEFKKILQEGVDKGLFCKDIDQELTIMVIFGTKNYLINSSHMSSRVMGHDILDPNYLETQLKPRMKAFMKQLLKSYLVKQ
ncbi:TetR/AcrR family transcriptional regulator [Mucilaginibacter sp. HMF5004]|uniref:TetR/AcrR family transcriptional regulator n=1 Tax=Mucilaginibacter rivuli TaxID=2857527 RepID=UPI001C5EB820|nr:TetR/AcrR family transcriptional regulator [Mucilaginibacter rivuli]MBW4890479.1 TetR/AcrR family transcriptional regulator [Mucilaginibacter rivuli]